MHHLHATYMIQALEPDTARTHLTRLALTNKLVQIALNKSKIINKMQKYEVYIDTTIDRTNSYHHWCQKYGLYTHSY